MTMSPKWCHGYPSQWVGRPPAGTSVFEWVAAECVPVYFWDFGDLHRWGETRWHRGGWPQILLNYKLTSVQQVDCLAHEMHHIARGGVCTAMCPVNERQVMKATARWLLPDLGRVCDVVASTATLDLPPGRRLGRSATLLGTTRSQVLNRLSGVPGRERETVEACLEAPVDWKRPAKSISTALDSELLMR